jgi:hypothetical protein
VLVAFLPFPDNAGVSDTAPQPTGRDEQHEIEGVVDRLAGRFPSVDRTVVAQIVEDEFHQLDGGRLRDFVPVLVEHAAHDRLRRVADPAPLDVTELTQDDPGANGSPAAP